MNLKDRKMVFARTIYENELFEKLQWISFQPGKQIKTQRGAQRSENIFNTYSVTIETS